MALKAYCELDVPHPSRPGRLTAAFSEPHRILTAATAAEVPGILQQAESWSHAGHWVIGFIAYEAAPALDRALHAFDAPPLGMPYAAFAVYRDIARSPRQRQAHLYGPWRSETARNEFDAAMQRIKEDITQGDYYQVNYTTRLRASFSGDALSLFDSLRASQPGAYCTFLDFGGWQICSVSPELFFYWSATDKETGARAITCRPMKGTAPRHPDPALDHAAATDLQHSPKERAENLMIVDLVRNDLSRVALPGTVTVEKLFAVEAWPTVWQMTTTVNCSTGPDVSLQDVFRALFPCGSVTGAPKAASMSAIRELEISARGVYCGAIGALLPDGTDLFSVGIRTPVISSTAQVAECGVGSGITADSSAGQEHAEWHAKQAFLSNACPEYDLLETLRLHQGRYWLLGGHLSRLCQSAASLGFAFSEKVVIATLQREAQRHPSGQWRIRLRLSAEGAAHVDVLPLDALPAQARSALSTAPVSSSNPWLRHKTTRREIYAAHACSHDGVFDTLLYNERGELTEFTRGNLVVELHGQLLTPPVECGLLPGIYRASLLAHRRIREGILRQDDLTNASRIWFVNSVRGAVQISF